jgi:hypothetical protein
MANDPLPLPDISAGSPDDPHGGHDSHDAYDTQSAEASQDAEYEAIHAEIAATERGRWFLSEHVKRNRAADTDRLVDSLARAPKRRCAVVRLRRCPTRSPTILPSSRRRSDRSRR